MNTPTSGHRSYRILIIDDNAKIHEDIRKVLVRRPEPSALDLDDAIVGSERVDTTPAHFRIDSAFQGEEGLARIHEALGEEDPYALVFVDMRMPPGIDGRETIRRLSTVDPHVQVVLCTAYSDYTWMEIAAATGPTDRLVILRKPFDCIEVLQLAHTLTEKWRIAADTRRHLDELQQIVAERTEELSQCHLVCQMVVEEALQHSKN
jgi:two-component system, NtrC family, sensor kinase